jgi:hypothetical protein
MQFRKFNCIPEQLAFPKDKKFFVTSCRNAWIIVTLYAEYFPEKV